MEILFNLVWLALSVGLTVLWLACHRRRGGRAPVIPVRAQLVALVILIVILLPVVSLTDDLQACTAPAEMEHFLRRGDPLAAHNLSLHPIAFALTGLAVCLVLSLHPRVAPSAPEDAASYPQAGHLISAGIRPPPFLS